MTVRANSQKDTINVLSRAAEYLNLIVVVDVDLYTVKRLESGGYEVEFPRSDYLPKIREQIDKRYPATKWHENSCMHEATLKVARPGLTLSTERYRMRTPTCQLTMQLGSAIIGERRLWVNDVKPNRRYAGPWVDTELCLWT